MNAATLIARKDLKLRLRDRSAIIVGIVTPLALAFIFNLVFGGATSTGALDLDFGLVDQDHSQVSSSFAGVLDQLQDDGLLVLHEYETGPEAEAAVDDGAIQAFYLIEKGLGDAVAGGQPFAIEVLGDIDAPTSTQIATSIAEQFADGVQTVQISIATAAALSPQPPDPDTLARWGGTAAAKGRPFVVSDVSAETRQLDSSTFFAAGMAVFFLFFTVQFGVAGILEEERDGTLARLLAAPIARTKVITGKAILAFALGLISMTVLVVATQLLMGANWGAPLGVAVLVVAGVLSAVSIMGVIASLSSTPEGAGNLGAIIAVVLGMLGGTFFPVGQGDDFLSKLSLITPHAWFMRGLGDLAGDAPWTNALPAAGAILIFAGVFGVIAWSMLRRKLKT